MLRETCYFDNKNSFTGPRPLAYFSVYSQLKQSFRKSSSAYEKRFGLNQNSLELGCYIVLKLWQAKILCTTHCFQAWKGKGLNLHRDSGLCPNSLIDRENHWEGGCKDSSTPKNYPQECRVAQGFSWDSQLWASRVATATKEPFCTLAKIFLHQQERYYLGPKTIFSFLIFNIRQR